MSNVDRKLILLYWNFLLKNGFTLDRIVPMSFKELKNKVVEIAELNEESNRNYCII